MSRAKGTRRPCSSAQARQRLIDAQQFLEAAVLLDAPDVVATNAIHAAIAAADAMTCHALGERSADGNHTAAAELVRQIDPKLATSLKRALDLKNQAAYESADLSAASADLSAASAASCVRWATQLVEAARERLL